MHPNWAPLQGQLLPVTTLEAFSAWGPRPDALRWSSDAGERSRTSTLLRAHGPEPSAEFALQPGPQPSFSAGAQQDEPYLGLEWTPAVLCLDSLNPSNPFEWPRFARAADRLAPYFGSYWVYISQACATWPASDPDRYAGPWNRERENPILPIGNSGGDPATPYEDAQSTARELGNARLLTLNTFGHIAVTRGRSSCVIEAVDRYLIDQELPPEGMVCEPDVGPFDAP